MKKFYFETILAGDMLAIVKDPSARGRVRRILLVGHFNGRVFNIDNFKKQNFLMLVRILVNISIELGDKNFLEWWNELGQKIYHFGENFGDSFNMQHQRKRRKR